MSDFGLGKSSIRNLQSAIRNPLVLILLLGFLVRLATIGYGTNVDEGDYLMQGREIIHGHFPYRDVHVNKPPLVSLLAAPFFCFSETPVIPARLFMILFSTSSLWAAAWLGRLTMNERAGLIAAGFLAFDPFAAVWAKPLHVSTLAPGLALWTLALWVHGLQQRQTRALILAGVMASLALLNKQTSVTLLPLLILFYGITRKQCSFATAWKRFCLGVVPLPLFVLAAITILGAWDAFVYDIYTGNLVMASFFQDTAIMRWRDFLSVEFYNQAAWRFSLLGILAVLFARRASVMILALWLLMEFWLNVFGLSHLWTHYVLAIMPPAYLLAGFGLSWGISRLAWLEAKWRPWYSVILVLLLTVPFWPRANWAYPNLTLHDEQALAAFIQRNCASSYLLCFADSSFYFWTGKQVPPSVRGDHITRIPTFMNTAGRKYLTLEDMKKTVEGWKALPMDLCVMYPKYYQQIFLDRDPQVEPVRIFLEQEFGPPQSIETAPTYYAQLIYFKRKG